MGKMYHIAEKKIPVCNDEGEVVKPSRNNGIKLESFIFDVFPLSVAMAIFEVERECEFAPVKNAAGFPSDSPDVARRMISNLAKLWLTEAGASLKGEEICDSCEVLPMSSYGGEGLSACKGKECVSPSL